MGGRAGVGGGSGQKCIQVVLYEFGVVFLVSLVFLIVLFLASAISSFPGKH